MTTYEVETKMSALEPGLGKTALKIGAAITVLAAEILSALAVLAVIFG